MRRLGGRGAARTALYALALMVLVAGVLHPLRRHVEGKRQKLLGETAGPGRRLALASQYAFATISGTAARRVPGAPAAGVEDLSSEAAVLVLGGFRGPYVVWLWMQVEEEKRLRIHFDLIDRYTMIMRLQPDYPDVIAFHIWNLAWNISVQWHSLEHKYQWIRRAIDFGREGVRLNPKSATLMAALGDVYLDKLGRSQEAEFYRRRFREEEGRSVFLAAYEWYDRARTAHDMYDTLRSAIADPVVYSQACHSVTYYAAELTQDAYDALAESARLREDGDETAAREAYDRARTLLPDTVDAWEWARREWAGQIARWGPGEVPEQLQEVYERFHREAAAFGEGMERLSDDLTYENVPELLPRINRPEIF